MLHICVVAKPHVVAVLIFAAVSSAFCADSEYSNTQAGVRMKVLNYDQSTPTLRIENSGPHTLAIQNNISLAVSFYNGGKKLSARPVHDPLVSNGIREVNIDQIAIIGPGACLEVPLRGIYFDLYEKGYGHRDNWAQGLRRVPMGEHSVRFTTNCLGMTALNVNFTPFTKNFDIPEFTITVKE